MLDPEGNTGVYCLYAYVRILSILEKSQLGSAESLEKLKTGEGFKITNQSERDLALALLRLPEQVDLAANDLRLNMLTDLLYEICVKISSFYNNSKVIGQDEEASRVLLLDAARKVLEVCFDLLGMKTIEKI